MPTRAPAPPVQRGEFLRGMFAGLLLAVVVGLAAAWMLGYMPFVPALHLDNSLIATREAPATVYWPFRSEWLTPREKE